jgi:hypothetical protein
VSRKKIKRKPRKSGNKVVLILCGAAMILVVFGVFIFVLVSHNKDTAITKDTVTAKDDSNPPIDVRAGEVDFRGLEELDLSIYGIPLALLAPSAAKQKDYYVDEFLSKDHRTFVDMKPKFDGSVSICHYPGQSVDIAGEIQKARSGGNWNNSFKILGQNERGFYFENTSQPIEILEPHGTVRKVGGKPHWQIEMFIPAGGRIWQISCYAQPEFSKKEADRRWAILQKIRVSTKPPLPPHPLGKPPPNWPEYTAPEFRGFVHVPSVPNPAKALKADSGVPWASSFDAWTFTWWIPRSDQRIEIYRLKPEQLREIQKDPETFLDKASADLLKMVLNGQKGTSTNKHVMTEDNKSVRDVVLKIEKGIVVCMRFILDGDRLFFLEILGEEIKGDAQDDVQLFFKSFLILPKR